MKKIISPWAAAGAAGAARLGSVLLFLLLPLAGVGQDTNVPAAPVSRQTNVLDHLLAPHDAVSFRILEDQIDPGETGAPKILAVTDSGGLEIPYIGLFPVMGKTCQKASEEIQQELEKKYYYQATVLMSLEVKAKSRGTCYISGQVRVTGAIEMPEDGVLTLSQAVVRAGGFTDYAEKRKVRLSRRSSGGTSSAVVDLTQVIEEGRTEKDIVLEPGDSIFVPSKLFSF